MELEHIAPYLPYGVHAMVDFCGNRKMMLSGLDSRHDSIDGIMTDVYNYHQRVDFEKVKLILRPLSDLTKSITHNGETFVPIEKLKDYYNSLPDSFVEKLLFVEWDGQFTLFGLEEDPLEVAMPYSMYQKVFEWHFDVFGLIESGEAIDINTLEK